MPKKKLVSGILLIFILLSLTALTAHALIIKTRETYSNFAYVKVVGIYNEYESLAMSSHRIEVYTIPENDVLQGVGSLQCVDTYSVKAKIFVVPGEARFSNACGPTPYATARTFVVWMVSGDVAPKVEVDVP